MRIQIGLCLLLLCGCGDKNADPRPESNRPVASDPEPQPSVVDSRPAETKPATSIPAEVPPVKDAPVPVDITPAEFVPPTSSAEIRKLLDSEGDASQLLPTLEHVKALGDAEMSLLPAIVGLLDHEDPEVDKAAADVVMEVGRGPQCLLYDFYAPWCGPCRTMAPIVDKLKAEGFRVRKVNTDETEDRIIAVYSIPTFALVIDGRVKRRSSGVTEEATLREMLEQIPEAYRYEVKFPAEAEWDAVADGRLWGYLLALEHEEAWQRQEARTVLQNQSPTVYSKLLGLLQDARKPLTMRRLAIVAAAFSEDPDFHQQLAAGSTMMIADEALSPALRGQAAVYLAERSAPDDERFAILTDVLKSELPIDLRAAAAMQIGRSNRPTAAAVLAESLSDGNVRLISACADALKNCGVSSVKFLPSLFDSQLRHGDVTNAVANAIGGICENHSAAAPFVISLLANEDHQSRAKELLLIIPDVEHYADDLSAHLKSDNPEVALVVSQILARDRANMNVVLPFLAQGLAFGDNWEVRSAIAEFGVAAIPGLLTELKSTTNSTKARQAVGKYLAGDYRNREIAAELLWPDMNSDDKTTAFWATLLNASPEQNSSDFMVRLQPGLNEDDEETRNLAVDAIGRLAESPEITQILLDRFSDENLGDSIRYVLEERSLTDAQVAVIGKMLQAEAVSESVFGVGVSKLSRHPEWYAILRTKLADYSDYARSFAANVATAKSLGVSTVLKDIADKELPLEVRREMFSHLLDSEVSLDGLHSPLEELLESEEEGIPLAAAAALAGSGKLDAKRIELLFEAMKSEEWSDRSVARAGLSRLPGDAKFYDRLAVLIAAMEEPRQAAETFSLLDRRQQIPDSMLNQFVAFIATQEGYIQSNAIDQMLLLPDTDQHVRRMLKADNAPLCCAVLARLSDQENRREFEQDIRKLTQVDDDKVSAYAVVFLCRLEKPAATDVERAIEILGMTTDDDQLKRLCLRGLENGGVAAIPAIPQLLALRTEEEYESGADSALINIARAAPAEAAEHLLAAILEDLRNRERLRTAFLIVGELKSEAEPAIPHLIAMLDDDRHLIKSALALAKIPGDIQPGIQILIQKLNDPLWRRLAFYALRSLGSRAPEQITAAVGKYSVDPNADFRGWTADVLAQCPHKSAEATLRTMLSDDKPYVKTQVIRALGNFGEAVGDLATQILAMAESTDSDLRYVAIGTYCRIVPADVAVVQIRKWIQRKDTRYTALSQISQLGADAKLLVPDLINLLDDEEFAVRAAGLLGEIGPSAAAALPRLRTLQTSLKEDWQRRSVASAIQKIADDSTRLPE